MGGILPVVFILGSTGSGKTKLSIELAKRFGGEIVGADSMQIYKALDIITAKATKEEQHIAPHHMIDILEPHETFSVVNYRNMALSIISDIIKRKHMPIVVGGTNYYIESLVWKMLIDDENSISQLKCNPGELPNNEHELPSEELHKKLTLLDPETARRLHPNNKRKIIRALEVFIQKGKKLSELLEEQHSEKGASTSGGSLRFPNALVLWLQCDQAVLDKRLNARVDSMIQQGLVNELKNFHEVYNEDRSKKHELPNYSKGIFQSIGFKEFHSYLMLNETERDTAEGQKKLEEGIELLRIATRQYARKQTRWTVNRFLGRKGRIVPPIYGLDTTNISQWMANVTNPAFKIVESYINGSSCDILPLEPRETNSVSNMQEQSYYCDICEKVFIGNHQWNQHLGSVRHKKTQIRKKKLKTMEKSVVVNHTGNSISGDKITVN